MGPSAGSGGAADGDGLPDPGWAGLSVHRQVPLLLGAGRRSSCTRPYLLGKGLHALCVRRGFTAAAVSLLPMEQPAWSKRTGGSAFRELEVSGCALIGTAGGIFVSVPFWSAGKTRKPVHTGGKRVLSNILNKSIEKHSPQGWTVRNSVQETEVEVTPCYSKEIEPRCAYCARGTQLEEHTIPL